MIDHSRDLDALDPPVGPDGGRLRETILRLRPEDLDRIVDSFPRALDSDHAKMLAGSGISPEVIVERGYRTITDKSVLESLGFEAWQARVPALLVPIRDREGHVVSVQIRPDRPRLNKSGKPIKYDSVSGAGHRIDFPSGVPLPGPEQEIWITEGVKKADSLASRGIYCLALPGVDTWSGPDAIQDLKTTVEWKGRTVIIAFDSDFLTNPRVANAREALTRFLGDRKATVRYLNLPNLASGKKQGVDDFFAEGQTLEDVLRLVSDCAPTATPDPVSQTWTGQLDRTPTGRLIANSRTLGLILRNAPDIGSLNYNEFSGLVQIGNTAVDDPVLFRLAEQIERIYGEGCTIPLARLREAVEAVAHEHPAHPVRDWLDSLAWDGLSRIEALFPVYYGTKDDEYTRAVGRNFLIGAVSRIISPGSQVDAMPILEGPQGILKSSSIQVLFGREWTAELKADPNHKDFEASLLGIWVLEFAELESLDRAGVGRIKLQLSVRSDWVRLSYRRDNQRYPRQCVFFGTTNDREYLKDATGSRRFWPIRCGQIDIAALARDRDQLLAEAVTRFKAGESWWKVPEQAADEQEARYRADSWEEVIRPFLSSRSETTTTEILEQCLEIQRSQHFLASQIRVGNALKRCGWERVKIRLGKDLAWVYRPPEPVPKSKLGTTGNNSGTSSTDAIVPGCSRGNEAPPSPTLTNNSKKHLGNMGTTGNNPVLEPCSQGVPNPDISGSSDRLGTDDWQEVE
ncbi:MAG: VapE family protein [Nitrospiraceae bacterium]|jgi:predicted P-loop ATPase|uniref:Virulence-associated protein E n=1 Tax=Leptospirillum ferriphilum (strain ML-04) TaxID=1048260 RepID=J9ZEM6_LEPFM|nr:VapE domain-containing protein [Leptospirillum ferriphilum]AFS54631.1 virulence-associated protein E [Leptospirillum ferriphilum ML-04]MDA8111007.1 VapE family protein [Nitrospiraceae bacterium]